MVTVEVLGELQHELGKLGKRVDEVLGVLKSDRGLAAIIANGVSAKGRADVAGLKRSSLEVTQLLAKLRRKGR